jgi:hypothetical protein
MDDDLFKRLESDRDIWRAIASKLAARLMSKPYNEFDKAALQQYLDFQEKR